MSVTYELKESVAHITLARQDSLNAMNRQMYAGVNAAFHRFNADEQARVGILKSSNPAAFCAGVDLKDVHRAITEERLSLEDLAEQLSLFIEAPGALAKPVIAAINGHCVGEGLIMTLFCDIRIAADDASFALPEAKLGVPSINGTIRAVQVAGHGPAMELLLTGESRGAGWALNAGFVNRVVPNDSLVAAAESMAASIVAGDDRALYVMRRLAERALDERFADLVAEGVALRGRLTSSRMVDGRRAVVSRPEVTDDGQSQTGGTDAR